MQTHNPYAAPTRDTLAQPASPPPTEVSAIAAIKWSFSGVGFGNLAVGLLLLLIPMIGGVLLMGWLAETHRRLALRIGPAVPKFRFSELANFAMSGLPAFAVQMAVALVAMLAVGFVAGFGGLVALATSQGGPDVGSLVLLGLMGFVGSVVAIGLSVLVVPMTLRGELTGSMKEAFNLSASIGFAKRNFWAILGHNILLALLATPLMMLGLLALFVGIYFVVIAMQFASMHLRWQIYERDVAHGGGFVQVRTQPGADL